MLGWITHPLRKSTKFISLAQVCALGFATLYFDFFFYYIIGISMISQFNLSTKYYTEHIANIFLRYNSREIEINNV